MEQSLVTGAIISQGQAVPKGPQRRLSSECQGFQVFGDILFKEESFVILTKLKKKITEK